MRSALGTEEGFRIPRPIQGSRPFIQDGIIVYVAVWTEQMMTAVPQALRSFWSDFFPAICSHEMVRVSCAPHRLRHRTNNRYATGLAHPSGDSFHPQLVQVKLQVAKHVVQFKRPACAAKLCNAQVLEQQSCKSCKKL